MSSYLLAPHVHLCLTAEAAVFLDLRTNRYLGLDGSCIETLRRIAERADADDRDTSHLGSKLVELGLMTTDLRIGRNPRPVSLAAAHSALVPFDPDGYVAPRWNLRHLRHLVASIAVAHTLWKLMPLRRYLARMAARKNRWVGGGKPAVDMESARHLVAVFQHLRPFFYSAQSRCLVDTMTLIEFLACHGVHADWVFGVQTRPFQAHTWLQFDGFVFNDQPSRTNLYTPILVL